MKDGFIACKKGDTNRLRKALENGLNVDVRDRDGLTMLMWCARRGTEDCASILLDQGAAIDLADCNRRSALHHAAMFGKSAVARLLIARGADIRHRDSWGGSALRAARGQGFPETYALIREAMVDQGVVLDESEDIHEIRRFDALIRAQPRGIRESDLSEAEVAKLRSYYASQTYRFEAIP